MKSKIFPIIGTVIPILLLGLNFTVENIDSYGVDKPALCVDDSGRVYVLGNSHGGRDVVKYIRKLTGPWLLDSILFSTENSINYNCRVSAALGSDRRLHVLYRVQGGTYGWPVYTNNSGGAFNTADTLTHSSGESTYEYGIAVDNLGRAHIVCDMSGGIRYYYPYADSQLQIAASAMDPSIAVDKNNVVHVAFASPSTNSKIYYTNNSSGSFGAPQLVSDSLGIDPSICADTAGRVSISWTQTNGWAASDLFYADNRTGSFRTRKVAVTPTVNEAWSQIARSRTNDIGIAYNLWLTSNTSKIMFAYKPADDSLFTIDTVSAGHWNQSYGSITWNDRAAVIDLNGYVHLAYAGASGTEYAKSQTPVGINDNETRSMDNEAVVISAAPNPFRTASYINIALRKLGASSQDFQTEGLRLRIYDATGRLVHSFALRNTPYALRWDGTDQTGRAVSTGVYILKVSIGKETAATTTLIRVE